MEILDVSVSSLADTERADLARERAELACARLSARATDCTVIGP